MLSLLLLATVPLDQSVVRESFDTIERNHFYSENGDLVFEQILFHRWHDDHYQIEAWRLRKSDLQTPYFDHDRGGWVTCFDDGGTTRLVFAKHFREQWEQVDLEIVEREKYPKEMRRELRKLGAIKAIVGQ